MTRSRPVQSAFGARVGRETKELMADVNKMATKEKALRASLNPKYMKAILRGMEEKEDGVMKTLDTVNVDNLFS